MGEYIDNISSGVKWIMGIIGALSIFVIKFFANMSKVIYEDKRQLLKNEITAPIEKQLDEVNKKIDILNLNFKEIYKQIENLTASVESAKRHSNKNSEHEIHLIEFLTQKMIKNDSNNKSN